MIEDVFIRPLKVFSDSRGSVLHMVRRDNDFFNQFGEIYFSQINPGIIKGWKKHLKMTQYFAVPMGNVKWVLYDERENSSTYGEIQEIFMGIDKYRLVCIPPLVWYSFMALENKSALIANCTDIPHDPKEVIVTDIFDEKIPYKWELPVRE
ncbi:MAG: dTDP-4-dehydrorhamnose 3,5-epimerase family protein [Candidatus Omnitrophica bacterium]|nr:dTDP-4-dehydrorhamnose 3,5-epimerase family protein [Candidatus Omnitrophota bacterium]